MALSSVYNLLHRHGWRKLAPEEPRPKSDDQTQQDCPPKTRARPRQDWAQGAPITRMFQDDAWFGCINNVCRSWAPRPIRPLWRAMLTHEYSYTYAAMDVQSGMLGTLV